MPPRAPALTMCKPPWPKAISSRRVAACPPATAGAGSPTLGRSWAISAGRSSALFSPVISGGIMLGCEAVRRGERLEVGYLFAGFQRHFGKLVAIGAISLGLGVLVASVMVAIVGVSFAGGFLAG